MEGLPGILCYFGFTLVFVVASFLCGPICEFVIGIGCV